MNHDEPPADEPEESEETRTRAWRIVDEWQRDGVTYVPTLDPGLRAMIDSGSVIFPPRPFTEPDDSAALWDDVVAFYREHFACEPTYYAALAAFCFLTYRIADADFETLGFLNFVGPPGSGKNRGLDVMRHTCWRTYYTRPTASNLHRVVDYFGDFSMVIDEFHIERGKTNAQMQELFDLLNASFLRSANLVKMDPDRAGGRMVPHLYRVFGPKIFASYDADSDPGFARRSIVVRCGEVDVPEAMQTPGLTDAAIDTARGLRARLLAFRARRLNDGKPELGDLWPRVREAAGSDTAQVFWPLVSMVPRDRPGAVDDLLLIARARRKASREAAFTSPEAYLLDVVAQAWEAGRFHDVSATNRNRPPGEFFVPTNDLIPLAEPEKLTAARLARTLRGAGLRLGACMIEEGDERVQRRGFLLSETNEGDAKAFARFGVAWPRPRGGDGEEPAL